MSDTTSNPDGTRTAPEADATDQSTGAASDGPEMLGTRGDDGSSAAKDPSDWVTGNEPMTAPQKSYLDTLAREAGEEIPADINKAEASEQIERLQEKTGRGQGS